MIADSLGTYLEKFGDTLAAKIDSSSKPLYDGERTITTKFLREPYGSQWHRIEAMVAAWNERQSILLSGRTGVGKTLISMAAVHAHADGKPYRALVICPPHLVRKWIRELKETIPGVKAKEIGKYGDAVKINRDACDPVGPEFYVLSTSKAKLGCGWRVAIDVCEREEVIKCCACSKVVTTSVGRGSDAVTVPAEVSDISKRHISCKGCGEPLWQWERTVDRWPVADYVKKKMRGFFGYLVFDESHLGKGATTAIGTAIGKLASTVLSRGGKSVAMTGTIINGYADSLFPTLFRFDASKMVGLDFDWGGSSSFVKRYGRLETVTTHERDIRYNSVSMGKQTSKRVRMRPGILPSMYGDCLMDSTVFMSLEDLEEKVVDQVDHLHPIRMSAEMAHKHESLESELMSILRPALIAGSRGAMSTMLSTLLGWPDYPFDFGPIGYKGEEGYVDVIEDPPQLSSIDDLEKDRKLLDIIRDQVSRGRQSWVYTTMTGKRDVQVRICDMLKREGFDARILRSGKVPTKDREKWIEENGAADVMIMHPRLVATGLDAFGKGYNFCSLIWYGMSYELDIVRQASGRARRIGQTKECEVHYLYYAETMQEKCANLMSEKTDAAQSIDGDFTESSFSALHGGGDNAQMMLVKELLKKGVLK